MGRPIRATTSTHHLAREESLADQEHALSVARLQHEIKELEHRYGALETQAQHDKP